MATKRMGLWVVYQVKNGKDEWKGCLQNLSSDCDVNVLLEAMKARGIIKDTSAHGFGREGDLIVMLDMTTNNVFDLVFREYAPPGPASDDCHTFS